MIVFHGAGNSKIGLGNLTRLKSIAQYLIKIKYFEFVMIYECSHKIGENFIVDRVRNFICKDRQSARHIIESNISLNENSILVTDLIDMDYNDHIFYKSVGFNKLIQINDFNVNVFLPDVYINSDIFKQNFNVDKKIKLYYGSKYMIIRDEIIRRRPKTYWHGSDVKNMLICFGGSDPAFYTEKILKNISNKYNYNFIIGPGFSKKRIENLKKYNNKNIKFFFEEKDMASRILENDIVITLGGLTTFEALSLGIPVICFKWSYMSYYVNNLIEEKWICDSLNCTIGDLHKVAKKGFEILNGEGSKNVVEVILQEKGDL